ncbi:MAG TPA: FUSC family protein [Gemmatimonadales bacterium]|nr:FUSC family protein [Gemmatimonadales bacterium]
MMPIRRGLERGLDRGLDQVRAATILAPARPNWRAGLRAAVATVVPLVAAELLHLSGGTWMSLVGFTGALADRGGPYRTRAETMGALTLGSVVAVLLGTVVREVAPLAVAVALVVAVVCGLARVWGNAGASVGGSVLNTFVIALAAPPHTGAEALARAGFALVGGLWAMLLALVVWPLRPYRPVRLAVAGCYRALADYADELAARIAARAGSDDDEGDEGGRSTSAIAPPYGSAEVRGALEWARTALARMRRGRPGESGRGERLLVLHELVDQQLGHLVALTAALEAIPRERRAPAAQAAAAAAVAGLARTARAVLQRIEVEHAEPLATVAWSGTPLRERAAGEAAASPMAAAAYDEAAMLLDRLAQYAGAAVATVATLDTGGPVPALPGMPEVAEPEPARGPLAALAPLGAILAPDSVVLRHALRIGIVVAVAVALTALLGLERGYWVTITAVIILQPYAGATSLKALQRVLGTVLGGVLTAGLGALFHDPWAILALAFVFAWISVALLPLNYAVFSMFLTPTFVLLAEAGVGDWHLAGIRVLNTVLGGALALAGARLLWPVPERSRLPAYVAAALRANARYLARAVALYGDRSAAAGTALRAARREVGLATVNAEESFQRLLAEHRGPAESLEPMMAALTYTRRLAASIAALAVSRHAADVAEAPPAPAALEDVRAVIDAVLADAADALLAARAPAPLPTARLVELPEQPRLHARLERVARQVRTLHDAVARWAGTSAAARSLPAGDRAIFPARSP